MTSWQILIRDKRLKFGQNFEPKFWSSLKLKMIYHASCCLSFSTQCSGSFCCAFGNVSLSSWQLRLFCVHLDIFKTWIFFLQRVASVGRTICQIFRQQPSARRLIIGEEMALHPPHIINPNFFGGILCSAMESSWEKLAKMPSTINGPLVITGQHSAKWLHSCTLLQV